MSDTAAAVPSAVAEFSRFLDFAIVPLLQRKVPWICCQDEPVRSMVAMPSFRAAFSRRPSGDRTCRGAVNAGLAVGERSWTCPTCETVLDRDGDAADDLRRLGLAAMADGPVPG